VTEDCTIERRRIAAAERLSHPPKYEDHTTSQRPPHRVPKRGAQDAQDTNHYIQAVKFGGVERLADRENLDCPQEQPAYRKAPVSPSCDILPPRDDITGHDSTRSCAYTDRRKNHFNTRKAATAHTQAGLVFRQLHTGRTEGSATQKACRVYDLHQSPIHFLPVNATFATPNYIVYSSYPLDQHIIGSLKHK
jgi:hypothetical protein